MYSEDQNPKVTALLRHVTFAQCFVILVAGAGLFFFPKVFRPLWAWDIAPFSTAFLGAIYLSALIPIAQMFFSSRWSPARVVLRANFSFTFVVLVASLYHFDKFDFSIPFVWVWFTMYIVLPANSGYHLWIYRSLSTDHLQAVSRSWSTITMATGILLGVYGLGMFVQPEFFSSLFPWKLDNFHSQVYSGTFIAGSAILLSVAKIASRAEFFAAGITEVVFGITSIAGLVIIDIKVQKIDWLAANSVSWVGLLCIITVLGVGMIFASSKLGSKSNP